MYGFAGKILHVNLTTRQIEVEQPSEEFYRTYWGGSLMGTYYLLRNTPARSGPARTGQHAVVYAVAHHRRARSAGRAAAPRRPRAPSRA